MASWITKPANKFPNELKGEKVQELANNTLQIHWLIISYSREPAC